MPGTVFLINFLGSLEKIFFWGGGGGGHPPLLDQTYIHLRHLQELSILLCISSTCH